MRRWLEVFRHFLYLGIDVADEVGYRHDGLLATALRTHGDGAVGSFLLADDDHVGDALQLVVANLAAEFLVAQVDGGTHPTLLELLGYLAGVVVVLLGQRQDGHLLGGEPQGEVAAGVLDEHGGEALERAEGGTVNHDGSLLLVVLVGILQLEALGQVVVYLDGA